MLIQAVQGDQGGFCARNSFLEQNPPQDSPRMRTRAAWWDGAPSNKSAQTNSAPAFVDFVKDPSLRIGTEFAVNNVMDLRYCRAMQRDYNVAALSEFMWNIHRCVCSLQSTQYYTESVWLFNRRIGSLCE